MPIEIKELNIKINVEEVSKHNYSNNNLSDVRINKLKTEITKACTKNVMQYIKEKQER